MVMVAERLEASGNKVSFSSFGEAADYVTMHGYRCRKVAPVEFAWSIEGGFSVKNSIAYVPLWFANFSRQVNQEIRNLIAIEPDVVVSDSRLSPIIAARILKIPAIVVLNQVKLLLSPRLRELAVSRFFENVVGEFLGSMWGLADRVLVPDLPPPFTISGHNIWGSASGHSVLEYVGFSAPAASVTDLSIQSVKESLGLDESLPLVFVHVSGPAQTRKPLIEMGIKAAALLEDGFQFVISEGRAGGSTEPRRLGLRSWYYEWCPVRDEIFSMCDLAVLRGGHVTLSQAIHFGKPVVTIPIENHGEQLGNSAKISDLGMGKMLHPKGLATEELASAIKEVRSDIRYSQKARDLQLVAQRMNGIDSISGIVQSYL
jgi:UDP:flavonoid glycosyltransferase YjiC (YdhE family)